MIAAFWSVAALAAIWYGLAHAGGGGGWRASVVKTISTAALARAGLAMGAPGWVVAGLALGAAGDFALSRPGTRWFLAGMGAFALGHLAYVAAFLGSFGPISAPGAMGWAIIAPLLALVLSTEVWLAPHTGALRWPVRGYGLVIGAMAVAAVLLPTGAGQAAMRAGAALFLASDLILAVRMFRLTDAAAQGLAGRLLWPLYWGGQALILWGAVAG
ncbi:lysoplasmalogenase [Gemmobacter sp.]|uniref:lysoplasmalogenase n=1 Tax=Gemmobacter sp. TaxID=1898957 RepID=UPI002AFF1FB6|nr:lysoplasmalogenase [Gemmobacter sp.]